MFVRAILICCIFGFFLLQQRVAPPAVRQRKENVCNSYLSLLYFWLYLSFVYLKTNCMFLTGSTEGSKTLHKTQNYTTMTKTDICCMLRRIETICWITFKSTHCSLLFLIDLCPVQSEFLTSSFSYKILSILPEIVKEDQIQA